MNNNEDYNAVMLTIWMPVRGVCACVWCLHLDSLLLAQLRQGFLDPESGESGGTVGIPTLPHYLRHYPQGLQRRGTTIVNMT